MRPEPQKNPRDWKSFSFETGHFLLHVPTAHVALVDAQTVDHVEGVSMSPDIEAALAELEASLPKPAQRARITPDISAISLNLAQGCNLRCTYCFAGEGDYGNKGMMTSETGIQTIRMLSAGKKSFHIVFFGGEPMLNFTTIEEVVAWCENQIDCRYSFSITTNGTLLNEKKIAWFKQHNFSMNLSYDGKGLQAAQRLNKDKISDSEALVTRKITQLSEALQTLRHFQIRATITRGNLDKLYPAILDTLSSTNYKMFVSHHATPLRSFAFTADDIDKLGSVYKRVIDHLLEENEFEKLLRLRNIKNWIDTIHRGRTKQMACGAGVNYLTVSTEGRFYLCHRFNEDESENYGSIEAGLNQEKLQAICDFRGAQRDPCRSCWMREWCAGGCFHEHKAAHGDIFDIDPMYCKLQALEIEQAMRVYSHLQEKAPQLLD